MIYIYIIYTHKFKDRIQFYLMELKNILKGTPRYRNTVGYDHLLGSDRDVVLSHLLL